MPGPSDLLPVIVVVPEVIVKVALKTCEGVPASRLLEGPWVGTGGGSADAVFAQPEQG